MPNNDRMECPICVKLGREPTGKLLMMGPTITCCMCRKTWLEHEFLGDVKNAGLSYYFIGSLEGQIVIYDPTKEKHSFIEPEDPCKRCSWGRGDSDACRNCSITRDKEAKSAKS